MSDIYEARERIAPVVRRTPLTSVESIDRVCGTTVPSNASLPKEQATRDYGAEVRFEVGALDDAFVAAKRWAAEHGAVFVPPFDDPHIIAGQGTLGLELHEQAPEARTILVPVGGGGVDGRVPGRERAECPDRTGHHLRWHRGQVAVGAHAGPRAQPAMTSWSSTMVPSARRSRSPSRRGARTTATKLWPTWSNGVSTGASTRINADGQLSGRRLPYVSDGSRPHRI